MLAKVLKKEEAARFIPFSLPEIGDGTSQTQKLNAFVVPNVSEIRMKERATENIHVSLEPNISAETLLQQAQEEAKLIIAQAEENKQIIEQAAREKALGEARTNFEAEVAEKVAEMRENLAETIAHVSALANEITRRIEPEVVELALQIAKKIVGREVTIDREIALTLVKISLGKLHNRSIAKVHLNPDDYVFVEAHRDKLEFRGSLEIVEDNSISVGGCLIHTETGDIDARIESQFDEIARGLLS